MFLRRDTNVSELEILKLQFRETWRKMSETTDI
jgi:hypothetical protein